MTSSAARKTSGARNGPSGHQATRPPGHPILTLGLNKFRFVARAGERDCIHIYLAFEGQAVGQVFVRGFVRAREEGIELSREVPGVFANLNVRIRAVRA